MQPTIILKQITADDAGTLLVLAKRIFYNSFAHLNSAESMDIFAARAFTIQQLTAEINNPDSAFYFVMLGDDIVGYLKLNYGDAQTEFQDKGAMEIERIYVAREYQGKKIGEQLINFAIETAKTKQLQYIWLGVWEKNPGAMRFYERNGFELFSSHKFMLGDEIQTDLLMKRSLTL